MPKTQTPRMEGWKGKSYDPKNWKSDPRAEKIGVPLNAPRDFVIKRDDPVKSEK